MAFLDLFRRKPEPAQQPTRVPHVPRRRNYQAAGNKAYYGSFGASGGSADYELSIGLKASRDRIRAMSRNSSTMRRFIKLMKDNVVGKTGFTLSVRTMIGDRLNDRLNDAVESAWADFSLKPTADRKLTMTQLEKLMVSSWCRDGEFFVEIVYGNQYPDGVAFHPIEADLIDEGLTHRYLKNGNQIRMGVEVTDLGEPVAYHVLNQHPGDLSWVSPQTKQRYRRVPADRVIHVYEMDRPGQTRGEPPAVSVVNTMRMLDGYREAEVTGRRVKSSAMGFITEDERAQARDDIDGMADDKVEGIDGEELEMYMQPGTLKKLPRGHDFKAFDPGGAQTDYAQFEAQIKTDASQGVSISPVSLGFETGKLSYSTHRGIVAEDRDMYANMQQFFIEQGMYRIFVVWLRSHVTYNTASEIAPSKILQVLANFRFMGRGWDYIDPSKDAKADIEMLKARTTSLTRIAARRGVSLDTLLQEIASDEKMLKRYGLTQDLGNGNNSETTSGDDNDGNDAET